MKSHLKSYIKSHKRLLRIARRTREIFVRRVPPLQAFKSFDDGLRDIENWILQFPDRYDLIIGIPRSGLFVASYLSTKLGTPLSTPDLFMKGEVWFTKMVEKPSVFKKVLLVDDGVGRVNGQMQIHYQALKKAFPDLNITRAALYVYPDCASAVELFYGYLEEHRLNSEEWNLLHRKYGIHGTDFDGVLCHDWDPERYGTYENFLVNAEPYMIPRFKIDYIVSSRSEKYRGITEEWLTRYKVDYGELILNEGSKPSAMFKAKIIKKLRLTWYWESNCTEAVQINNMAKLPVLSIEGMTLVGRNEFLRERAKVQEKEDIHFGIMNQESTTIISRTKCKT